MKKLILIIALVCVWALPATADTLWYNGDLDGNNGLANQVDAGYSHSIVYDDFVVPTGGWNISSVWSNNTMNFASSTAFWEIRSGVSEGFSGTLVAGDINTATQTATTRSLNGLNEYTIQVTGLNVYLAPGKYWLGVAPIGSGGDFPIGWDDQLQKSFVSTTSGVNGVAAIINGEYFWNNTSTYIDPLQYFIQYAAVENVDFSMGVASNAAVPLPPSALLLGSGLLGLGGFAWRRRRN